MAHLKMMNSMCWFERKDEKVNETAEYGNQWSKNTLKPFLLVFKEIELNKV